MGLSGDEELRRWGIQEMGSLGDEEFLRWRFQETCFMCSDQHVNYPMPCRFLTTSNQ